MHLKHKLLGLIFLALLASGIYMTNAAFTKKFAEYDKVALQTSKIGLQLPSRADVKIRGVIIGEVLEIEATEEGALLTLGIYPSQTETVPANVTGSIVPKTLFGEKYVSLIIPDQPAGDAIQAGATIERTAIATEVEKVLADLYPLLTAVAPADINMTLNAMATALEGRGDQLGANLETVDSYLKRLNPQLPALVEDLRLTAKVSDLYAEVLPEIGTILQNTVTTMTTLEDRAAKLDALFADVSQFSGTARSFLKDNGDNLIRLGEVSRAQLRVFARYSPEFPCLLRGIYNAQPAQAESFRNFTLHIVLETLPNQPRGYTPEDVPRFGDDRGPACLHLPNPPWSQSNPVTRQPNFKDNIDEPTGKGTSRTAPSYGYVGSPEETELLNSLLAPGLGVTADQVPDLGALLLGPMARGATVTVGEPADSAGGSAR